MPSNVAAFLVSEKAYPLEVKPSPYPTTPQPNEIIIRNHAIAVNPVDWAIQAMGSDLFSWLTYPAILGSDVSGEVVEIGSAITRFKVGDRVVGHAIGLSNAANSGGYQIYVTLMENMTSQIPSTLSYENACVLPLGLSTAASGLFQKDYLNLQHPTVPPKPTGKTLLVWAGSTSVGCNGIQLGVAAGYEVFTTCSPRNYEYVKKLGASQVFDYSSPTVVEDILVAFKGKTCAGALAIGHVSSAGNGTPAAVACLEIVAKSDGDKFVALGTPTPQNVPEGVGAKFIFGSDLKNNEVSTAVYEKFLPKALAEDKYITAPEPMIVGKGLEFVQKAFDVQKAGVSAKKVVITL